MPHIGSGGDRYLANFSTAPEEVSVNMLFDYELYLEAFSVYVRMADAPDDFGLCSPIWPRRESPETRSCRECPLSQHVGTV